VNPSEHAAKYLFEALYTIHSWNEYETFRQQFDWHQAKCDVGWCVIV